jgi:hypothetical protein
LDGTGAAQVLSSIVPAPGQIYHCVGITRSRSDHTLFVNGVKNVDTTDVGTSFSGFVRGSIGAFLRGSTFTSFLTGGGVYWAAYGTKDPGDVFLGALSMNPWAYLYPRSGAKWFLDAPAAPAGLVVNPLSGRGGGAARPLAYARM